MTMAKEKHFKAGSDNSLSKMSEKLKARLKYAVFKVDRGWENQTLDQVENLIRKKKGIHKRSRSINDLETTGPRKTYSFDEYPRKVRSNSFSRLISPREDFLQLISRNFSSSSPSSASSSLDRTSPSWLNSHDTILDQPKIPFDLPSSPPIYSNGSLATILHSHMAFLNEGGQGGFTFNHSPTPEFYTEKNLKNQALEPLSLSREDCKAAEAILSLVHAVPTGNFSIERFEG